MIRYIIYIGIPVEWILIHSTSHFTPTGIVAPAPIPFAMRRWVLGLRLAPAVTHLLANRSSFVFYHQMTEPSVSLHRAKHTEKGRLAQTAR